MTCRLQTFCSFDSRSGSLFERPWAFKISPSLLCARLDGKRSMLLLGHSVITRQFGQLKPLPVCCRNHLWRQDLQKVCWHVRSFGWLVSVNWSWQREHSNSFLIASKRLSQPAINFFESFSPGCRDLRLSQKKRKLFVSPRLLVPRTFRFRVLLFMATYPHMRRPLRHSIL